MRERGLRLVRPLGGPHGRIRTFRSKNLPRVPGGPMGGFGPLGPRTPHGLERAGGFRSKNRTLALLDVPPCTVVRAIQRGPAGGTSATLVYDVHAISSYTPCNHNMLARVDTPASPHIVYTEWTTCLPSAVDVSTARAACTPTHPAGCSVYRSCTVLSARVGEFTHTSRPHVRHRVMHPCGTTFDSGALTLANIHPCQLCDVMQHR